MSGPAPRSAAGVQFSEQITKVLTKEDARRVLKVLNAPEYANHIWACDTEVADINLKEVGPVGNGKLICLSLFGGPDVDFGDGPGTTVWIDNLSPEGELLQEFREWFEDDRKKKVWHNYGFDRHILNNEGVDVKGFWGDTMHMARLNDTSRDRLFGGSGDGYSLEALSKDFVADERLQKVSMKDLFGVGRLKKDGSAGAVKDLPPMRDLQLNPAQRETWIIYSARDAVATWYVRYELESALAKKDWILGNKKRQGNMYDFYQLYLREFGELLTDMERVGIRVDTDGHLKNAEVRAREEREKMQKTFMDWASTHLGDQVKHLNTASSTQIGHFLFGHYVNNELVSLERTFKLTKGEEEFEAETAEAVRINPYVKMTAPEIKALLKERGLKVSGKKADLVQRLVEHDANPIKFDTMDHESLVNMCASRGLACDGTKEDLVDRLVADSLFSTQLVVEKEKAEAAAAAMAKPAPKKTHEITIRSVGLLPLEFTPAGTAQVSAAVLNKLAGKNLFGDKWEDAVPGRVFNHFRGGEEGKAACRAIGALANVGQIDATITNFLGPLQTLVDKNKRIHCSLNLNTETGRLSSRRPNLQNQPALEKDQYKIRDAFVAEPGNTLIVADYGQLELRLLAHITNCQSMIDAFAGGGCFHSRTAVGMYKHVREAVDNGEVLLEWDYSKGQPTVPLVKDTYASERRKAKTLNFSIAYGKTVHGLALDWGISTEEADETLKAWYADRPEVEAWQKETRRQATKEGFVRTIMGRYRMLPDARTRNPKQNHALRAAINTPIQGSAADVVMMAMLKLKASQELKSLGWRLLLQIHDEVILEGPMQSKDEAMKEVRACMENPWDHFGLEPLKVHLDVDAKSDVTWYRAK